MLITHRALVNRLRRFHRRQDELFRVTRSDRYFLDLGYWHAVDMHSSGLLHRWHSLGALVHHARDVGVLQPHEYVQMDGDQNGVAVTTPGNVANSMPR